MKFISLYSNREDVFPAIHFHDHLNVIFAQVKDPRVTEQDSHNLGKTFLIQVIDFVLLAKIDKHHPFRESQNIFEDFVFYLQIETPKGTHITVRRQVTGNKGISIHVHKKLNINLINISQSDLTYPSLGIEKANEILNNLLALDVIKPYVYRKGLGYILRRQNDYDDEFRVASRFARSRDQDWKPYLALVLGFNYESITSKYKLDRKIDELQGDLKRVEREAGSEGDRYDAIKGVIDVRQSNVDRLRNKLDEFSFREFETQINQDVVLRIEKQIADLNEEQYTMQYEISEISKSLEAELEFDIDQIQEIFREVEVILPKDIVHDYKQLEEFNRRLSSSRNERLQNLRQKLLLRSDTVNSELERLDTERQNALSILSERETFEKYKALQRRTLQEEEEIFELQQKLIQLDKATLIQRKIEDVRRDRLKLIDEIESAIRSNNNDTYTAIRRTFTRCVEEVLNIQAILSVTVNREGNLDFKAQTIERTITARETNEGLGTSYKKILCACFDLSLILNHTSDHFYRVVYHDGIFEGLDNRKKVNLLRMIRRVCVETDIQYILTVIDSDLPRDETDQKLLFTKDEIVRELHDTGDEGRLFQMSKF